jgi:hypothetical protein
MSHKPALRLHAGQWHPPVRVKVREDQAAPACDLTSVLASVILDRARKEVVRCDLARAATCRPARGRGQHPGESK